MKPQIIQLVDSIEYVETNCFQHQLLDALKRNADVNQVTIAQLPYLKVQPGTHHVLSCLKMRTVHRSFETLKKFLGDCPLVMYEQDVWHGYMDDSTYKGFYDDVKKHLNLSFVAVTSNSWAKYLQSNNVPSQFVKMWMLPRYCSRGSKLLYRPTELGFVGSVHSYRKELFDTLSRANLEVKISGGYDYTGYLRALGDIKIYVRSEDYKIAIDGVLHKELCFTWVKDIEVGARGCISVRNWDVEKESYITDDIKNTFSYRTLDEVPEVIRNILDMDERELNKRIESTVEYIRDLDEWSKTAKILIKG